MFVAEKNTPKDHHHHSSLSSRLLRLNTLSRRREQKLAPRQTRPRLFLAGQRSAGDGQAEDVEEEASRLPLRRARPLAPSNWTVGALEDRALRAAVDRAAADLLHGNRAGRARGNKGDSGVLPVASLVAALEQDRALVEARRLVRNLGLGAATLGRKPDIGPGEDRDLRVLDGLADLGVCRQAAAVALL